DRRIRRAQHPQALADYIDAAAAVGLLRVNAAGAVPRHQRPRTGARVAPAWWEAACITPGLPAALEDREVPGASGERERSLPPPVTAGEGERPPDDDRLHARVLEGEAKHGPADRIVDA